MTTSNGMLRAIPKWHEAAVAFPLISQIDPGAYEAFKQSVKDQGVLVPIEVYGGERWPQYVGWGIDGRNREVACKQLGIEFPVKVLSDEEIGDSIVQYIISKNFRRRQMTSAQSAAIAVQMQAFLDVEAEALGRKSASGNNRVESKDKETGKFTPKSGNQLPQIVGEPGTNEESPSKPEEKERDKHAGESAQKIAESFQTNRQYVQDCKYIALISKQLLDRVIEGKVSIDEAKKAIAVKGIMQSEFPKLASGDMDPKTFLKWVQLRQGDVQLYQKAVRGKLSLKDAVAELKRDQKAEKERQRAAPSAPSQPEPITSTDGTQDAHGATEGRGEAAESQPESFSDQNLFVNSLNKINRQLDDIIRQLESMQRDPLGSDIHWRTVIDNIRASRQRIHMGRPVHPCLWCQKTGDGTIQPTCKPCQGTGYIARVSYKSACESYGVPFKES